MKKIFFALALLIVLSSAPLTVFADTLQSINERFLERDSSIPVPTEYIIDTASLLTAEQVSKLEAKTAQIKETYDFDVVIVAVPDLSGKTPQTYSMDFYIDNGYNENGIIFLVSMADRDWDISTFNYGLSVFTEEYGLDYVSNNVLPALSEGNYNKSFSKFLNYADAFLLEAKSGTPYSTDNTFLEKNTIMLFSIIGAFVIAIVVIVFMASHMNTKKPKDLVHEYVNKESIHETERSDMFLYRTVTKTEKPKRDSSDDDDDDDDSSGSGGRSGKF